MRTKARVPGQNFQGVIGYRIHLGWRDRLMVLVGAPLTLGMRIITPIPVPNIRTDARLLVAAAPARRGSSFEILDIPPGAHDAPPTG